MQRSMQRILAMHTDSLPRPDDLLEMFMAREQGPCARYDGFLTRVCEAISGCIRKQWDIGLDIVNDGEWSKPDYSTYVKSRLTGLN
jgi:5-methyltetrahydropteroyltriglutamate--homocysteine methyltransferase